MKLKKKIIHRIFLFGVVLFALVSVGIAQENRPVGTWKDLLPYEQVLEVAAGDGVVYARTEFAVFSVDPESGKINRHSQVQGLSQSDPSAIAVAQPSIDMQVLIVGYANGNVDLLTDAGVYNMPDIVNSNLFGDKRIRSIYIDGTLIYLSCGFGVVVLDIENLEVKDTWYIKGQQDLVEVTSVTKKGDKWIVTTDRGIFEASTSHPFLSSAEAWTQWSDVPATLNAPDARVTDIHYVGDDALVHLGDELEAWLWIKNGDTWTQFAGWPEEGDKLNGIDSRNDTLVLGRSNRVERYDTEYNLIPEENALGTWMYVSDVKFGREEEPIIWIASQIGGLIRFVPNPVEGGAENSVFKPEGPRNSGVCKLDCWNANLWFATGSVDATWTSMYSSDGIHGLVDFDWVEVAPWDGENDIPGIRDYIDVSIDPLNPKHVMFASWEEGLVEVLDGEIINIYNSSNSPIQEGDFGGSFRTGIGGVDYDKHGNLWFSNPWTNSPLHVLMADGTFHTMDLGDDFTTNDNLGTLMVTWDGYVWGMIPRGGGVFVFDPNGTPEDTSDDDWRFLTTNETEGGLPSNYVYCFEEDLDGEIWLGTQSGPAVFYRTEPLFTSEDNIVASQILIQQDGNYQYMLETESISSIVIDGGNRKWVGTSGSGVYVLSDDGQRIEHEFSTNNSPIPDNNIRSIAINYNNGEVYVGTNNGTVSYLSESTNWDIEMEDIFVFPNPVKPDHDGPIVVDGLDYESVVHVTNAAGRVIAIVESMGGRAIWDGNLDDGTPAPYGVYLIFAVDSDGNVDANTKLAITR